MEDTTQKQKRMEKDSLHRILDACRTFNEIMLGPNPLTKSEIRKLVAKRPETWGIFHSWTE